MSLNRIVIEAPPAEVFETLLDADTYERWVVGARKIRAVDPEWPAEGSRFHHSVGAPPSIDDNTKILAVEPNRRLELEARFRPLGVARVIFTLEPIENGRSTLVTMTEEPIGGPLQRLDSRPLHQLLWARNAWSLARLRKIVLERHKASGPGSHPAAERPQQHLPR
jgi:uncharacterized protein YndB with AHSA1/START domain